MGYNTHMEMKYELNKIYRDEFGRPTAILALDKEAGISSHDLVDKVRRNLDYKKVGHAGALDNFATGLMIILVGKATKLSDTLINKDKQYHAQILLGIATDTQDPEGVITDAKQIDSIDKDSISKLLQDEFLGNIEQHVSVYSSVKVDGAKLRILMRDERFDNEIVEDGNKKFIKMLPKEGVSAKEKMVEVPRREIEITNIELVDAKEIETEDLPTKYLIGNKIQEGDRWALLDIVVDCSKGTYVRQLAEDIGKRLGYPASLLNLRRTRIANVYLDNAISLDLIS